MTARTRKTLLNSRAARAGTRILRVIVEDVNGVCILNNPLETPVSISALLASFPEAISIDVDTVGTALVRMPKALPRSFSK